MLTSISSGTLSVSMTTFHGFFRALRKVNKLYGSSSPLPGVQNVAVAAGRLSLVSLEKAYFCRLLADDTITYNYNMSSLCACTLHLHAPPPHTDNK